MYGYHSQRCECRVRCSKGLDDAFAGGNQRGEETSLNSLDYIYEDDSDTALILEEIERLKSFIQAVKSGKEVAPKVVVTSQEPKSSHVVVRPERAEGGASSQRGSEVGNVTPLNSVRTGTTDNATLSVEGEATNVWLPSSEDDLIRTAHDDRDLQFKFEDDMTRTAQDQRDLQFKIEDERDVLALWKPKKPVGKAEPPRPTKEPIPGVFTAMYSGHALLESEHNVNISQEEGAKEGGLQEGKSADVDDVIGTEPEGKNGGTPPPLQEGEVVEDGAEAVAADGATAEEVGAQEEVVAPEEAAAREEMEAVRDAVKVESEEDEITAAHLAFLKDDTKDKEKEKPEKREVERKVESETVKEKPKPKSKPKEVATAPPVKMESKATPPVREEKEAVVEVVEQQQEDVITKPPEEVIVPSEETAPAEVLGEVMSIVVDVRSGGDIKILAESLEEAFIEASAAALHMDDVTSEDDAHSGNTVEQQDEAILDENISQTRPTLVSQQFVTADTLMESFDDAFSQAASDRHSLFVTPELEEPSESSEDPI